jgi:hypothetical protein
MAYSGAFTASASAQSLSSFEVCNTNAFTVDPDPQGLNVRVNPNADATVVGRLPEASEVIVLAMSGNRVLVYSVGGTAVNSRGNVQVPHVTGWVSASLLGTATRGYGSSNGVALYQNPSEGSTVIARVPSERPVNFVGCQGSWVQVEYQGKRGWLKQEDQCAATLTTCS